MTRGRLALATVLLVGIASAVMIQSFSWNQTSHYDLTRALNDEETTIDRYQANTGDKVFYKGHYYSARAPGLALFSMPFYDVLSELGAESWTDRHVAPPDHPGDEMIYLLGLWSNVLPGLLLVLLVWRVADRFEPGYGIATAVVLAFGTMVLPFSQLLFSHMFTTFLAFAAFWLMLREREGPPDPLLLGIAGLAMGYAFSSEYPTFFAAVVLGGFLLSRKDSLTRLGVLRRGGAYVLGGLIGIIPLLLYNHFAFHSWTHLAYENVKRQQKGFFGIDAPSLRVLITLLFDSRGLFTISPVLIMGGVGTAMLYKRGRRAEALTITAICLCFMLYNSGYFLPFGGGFMGPRFLDTLLPFLAFPIALALKRYPGPTIALAAISITTTVIATITHPLVGYENETVTWMRFLSQGFFQPTIASAYGLGRGWGGIWPFLVPAGAAIALAAYLTPRLRLSAAALRGGLLVLVGWALFAALAPTILGIDHSGLHSIFNAGDHTAYNLKLHSGARYPLKTLAPVAAGVGLLALGAMRLLRNQPPLASARRDTAAGGGSPREPALSA
jgi:4-amino-4-deoxy-L-arabinose transferase-like glycosyltransferase